VLFSRAGDEARRADHARTAEETCRWDLCARGQGGGRVKDAPGRYGFIANRIYFAAVREAQKVLEEGIASAEDINKAMVFGFNWPVGPLAMIEGATKGWQPRASRPPRDPRFVLASFPGDTLPAVVASCPVIDAHRQTGFLLGDSSPSSSAR
jgi:hypothetical protein